MALRDPSAGALKVGTYVTLKSMKYSSYLSAEGILDETVFVSGNLSNFDDNLFQVCIQLQYSASKELEDFMKNYDGNISTIEDIPMKKYFDALAKGKSNEIKMNETFMKLKMLNVVLFGDIVQLRHVKSGKFLNINPSVLARDERENVQVYLDKDGSSLSWFMLMPRYKVDHVGDKINSNTELVLVSAERPAESIRCADKAPPAGKYREVNSSTDGATPWKLTIFQNANDAIENRLMLGQLVFIKDPETQCLLTPFVKGEKGGGEQKDHDDQHDPDNDSDAGSGSGSDKEDDDDVSISSHEEYIHDHGELTLKHAESDFPDTNSVWVLESQSITKGGPIHWRSEHIRLRHFNSGLYLAARTDDYTSSDKSVFCFIDDPYDKRSLFQVNELHSTSDFLTNNKPIQVRHNHTFLERGEYHDRHKVYNVNGVRGKGKACNFIVSAFSDAEEEGLERKLFEEMPSDLIVGKAFYTQFKRYVDMTEVPEPSNTRSGSVWTSVDSKGLSFFDEIMYTITKFLDGYPILFKVENASLVKIKRSTISRRQKMFREQGVLSLLIQLLRVLIPISQRRASLDAAPVQLEPGGLVQTGCEIISKCLILLKNTMHKHPFNQMYIADNLLVVLAHVGTDDVAGEIAEEFFSTNRELQETKIGIREVKIFVERMRESEMNATFLNLLRACCSCNGVGLYKNQALVKALLFEGASDLLIKFTSETDNKLVKGELPPQAYEWQAISAFSLYLPDSADKATVLASGLLRFVPQVFMTWSTKMRETSPVLIYGKQIVNIESLLPAAKKDESDSIANTIIQSLSKRMLTQDLRYNEEKNRIMEFLVAQLYLAAEICLDRNYEAIALLEKQYPVDSLIASLTASVPDALKGAVCRLLTTLYVDRDLQLAVDLPRYTRTLMDLSKPEYQIVGVEGGRVHRFCMLQMLVSDYVKKLKGRSFNEFSLNMLLVLHKLFVFHFYSSKDKIVDIIGPLLGCLQRQGAPYEDTAPVRKRLEPKREAKLTRARSRRLSGGSLSQGGDSSSSSAVSASQLVPRGEGVAKSEDMSMNSDEPSSKASSEGLLEYMQSLRHLRVMLVFVLASLAITVYDVIVDGAMLSWVTYVDYAVVAVFFLEAWLRMLVCVLSANGVVAYITDVFNVTDFVILYVDIALLVLAGFFEDNVSIVGVRFIRFLRLARFGRLLASILHIGKIVSQNVTSSRWTEPLRYTKTSPVGLATMLTITNVLSDIQRTVEDRNLSLLLHAVMELRDGGYVAQDVSRIFNDAVEAGQELSVSNNEHDDIYIDLLMYAHPPVVQKTLEILMDHHSSRTTLLGNIKKIQIISSGTKQQQFELISGYMFDLKRHIDQYSIWGKLQNEDHVKINKAVFKALDTLTEFCRLKRKTLKFDEIYEADRGSQDIMRNMGLVRVGIQFLEFLYDMDPNEVNSKVGKNLMKLLLASNTLMYWLIVDNPQNQSAAFAHLTLFVRSIDSKINSHKIIQAIFSNNELLIRSLPKLFIMDAVDMICNTGKFPQYLALLGPLVAAGQKNIIENQYKVINQFSSPGSVKKIIMFFQGPTHLEYLKKIKLMSPYLNKKDISADDLPSDLTYHLDLMDVLSRCTIGTTNMTTIEAKVQSMFYFADVINSMLDPQCLLLAKIRLGLFLYNAVIDVEMRVSALTDADVMWKLIISTIDVLGFAKDEIRLAEKEGLHSPASHRQALEYVVVCAMIVGGFFEFYHDSATFRSDMSQATVGVERVVLKEKEGNDIIRTIFNNIRSIYDLQSPIFDNEHHDVFYRAMVALNKASTAPIVSFIEKLHGEVTDGGAELKARSSTGSNKFDKFVEMLLADKDVQESAENQVQDFISKLDALSLEDDVVESDVRFEPLASRLLNHIRNSVRVVVYGDETMKQLDEKSSKTSIWVLKIFRTMIENRWGMTIDERDDDGGEEQDVAAEAIMSTLNRCGATEVCLDLLSRGIEIPLQAEAIKLLVALLFKEGGALEVQKSINRHLSKPGSELFFLHIRSLIQNLISWHKWQGVVILEDEDAEPVLPDEIILIRMLQLVCEGHYMPNQDILREQKSNLISVNLLDDFVAYMQALDSIPCRTSTKAAGAVSATILEVIQGPCVGNQMYFATESELIELLNKKLRQRVVADMDEDEEIELKKTAVDIFQGMLEGQGSKTTVYERMLSVIHLDVLQVLSSEGGGSEEALQLRTECLVLMQMFLDFRPSIIEEFGIANDAVTMREMGIACVEVVWNGELQRRFFHIPDICGNLAKSTKDDFILNCNRDSPEDKLYDLMDAAKNIHFEIRHQERLKEMNIAFLFSQLNQDRVSWMTFNFIVVINLLFIIFYSSYAIECTDDAALNTTSNSTVRCSEYFIADEPSAAIDAISIVIIVLSAMVLIVFITVRVPVNYIKNVERGYTQLQCVLYTATDPMTLYNSIVFLFAVLGYEYHFLLTLLMLDYMTKSPILMKTLAAVFVPWRQICITIALTWIVTWIYAMFFFFEYNDSSIVTDQTNSITAVNTLKWFIRYGSESGSLLSYGDISTTVTTPRYVLEFTFFIVMVTMWNIIKGITIDSFLSLREKSLIKANDTETVCFMCNIDKLTFTRAIGGDAFREHIQIEQNLWNYIYFIIFIQEQDKDDDDGLEYYVRHMLEAKDLGWFPMNKAIKMAEYQQRSQKSEITGKFNTALKSLESEVQQRIADFKDHFARNLTKVESVMKHGTAPPKSSHNRRNASMSAAVKTDEIGAESEIRLTILRIEGVQAITNHELKVLVQMSTRAERAYSSNSSDTEGPFTFMFDRAPIIVHKGHLNVTSNAMFAVKLFWKRNLGEDISRHALTDEPEGSELLHYCNITLSSLLSHIADLVDAAPPPDASPEQREISFSLHSFCSEEHPRLVCTVSCSQAYIEKLKNSMTE